MSPALNTFWVTIWLLAATSTTSRERRSRVMSMSVSRRPKELALVTGRLSITQL